MKKFIVRNNGTYPRLTYDLNETEQLDQDAVHMISDNQLDGILSLKFQQFGLQRSLSYDITSKISLDEYLNGTLSKENVFNVFESICTAFSVAEMYLLDSAGFILDKRYVYVDGSTGKMSLVYLPVINAYGEERISLFLKELIFSIKPNTNDGCSNLIGAILAHLNSSDHFSISELQKQLLICKNIAPTGVTPPERQKPTPQPKAPISKTPVSVPPVSIPPVQDPPKKVPEDEAPAEKLSLVWLLRNFSGENLAKYNAQKKTQKANQVGKSQKEEGKQRNQNFSVPNKPDSISYELSNEELNKNISDTPKLVVDPDATIGVDPDATIGINAVSQHSAFLTRLRTNEVIEITGVEFVIGRSSQNTNYQVKDNRTIGRLHATIMRYNDRFFLTDLNSKNHTYINNNRLENGSPEELSSQDVIRLSNEEFIFFID